MAVIYYVSDLSGSDVRTGVDDRISHLLEYFVLAIMLMFAAAGNTTGYRAATLSLIVGGLYAVSDEWHQSFVPGRDPSLRDLLFDGAGLILGVALSSLALSLAEPEQ